MPTSRIKGQRDNLADLIPKMRKEIETRIHAVEDELEMLRDDLDWCDRVARANANSDSRRKATVDGSLLPSDGAITLTGVDNG